MRHQKVTTSRRQSPSPAPAAAAPLLPWRYGKWHGRAGSAAQAAAQHSTTAKTVQPSSTAVPIPRRHWSTARARCTAVPPRPLPPHTHLFPGVLQRVGLAQLGRRAQQVHVVAHLSSVCVCAGIPRGGEEWVGAGQAGRSARKSSGVTQAKSCGRIVSRRDQAIYFPRVHPPNCRPDTMRQRSQGDPKTLNPEPCLSPGHSADVTG